MKRLSLLCGFLSLTISMPLFAKDYNLSIKNYTNETLSVVRKDGSYVVLPAQGYVASERFRVRSEVTNFINGKKVCSWVISESDRCYKTTGLNYGPDSHGHVGCNLEMLQRYPC
ncbi:MAG: hypothetical protein H0W64_09905 [Gammaproteobacteria bacterium]|nr:hypothetical protein [Gammaproteobacteria bacterium]